MNSVIVFSGLGIAHPLTLENVLKFGAAGIAGTILLMLLMSWLAGKRPGALKAKKKVTQDLKRRPRTRSHGTRDHDTNSFRWRRNFTGLTSMDCQIHVDAGIKGQNCRRETRMHDLKAIP